jgi:hypothetical protein
MRPTLRFALALSAAFLLAAPVAGEEITANITEPRAAAGPEAVAVLLDASGPAASEAPPAAPAEAAPPRVKARPIAMQYFRALDQRGLNVFEAPKEPGVEYTGFKLDWGAAFTSQVQALDHSNTALPVTALDASGKPYNANQLADIGFGFNNSTANLYLHAQLARGIRVQLTTYLSSRHHNEAWVKDGYILIDESPIDFVPLQALMQYLTVKVGHFEINYGDAHFRRSDNGNAMYNPFVGNYILDAFTTEIGGEVYLRSKKGLIAMGSVTGGEIRGTVLTPERRGPTFIGKLGFDRQINPDLRVRLTGSGYRAARVLSNTLYGGDRAGSRYYYVVENTLATESAQFTSGLINPGFRNAVTALQINPFVKFRGLELFGVIERAEGRAAAEAGKREFNQYALDVVYRLPGEKLFVGARYNTVEGQLLGISGDVGADRWQFGGGWFILPGVLAKLEYVNQEFKGFPPTNIKNGGKFNGLMLEGVVAF